jgi:hypothetical protein
MLMNNSILNIRLDKMICGWLNNGMNFILRLIHQLVFFTIYWCFGFSVLRRLKQ